MKKLESVVRQILSERRGQEDTTAIILAKDAVEINDGDYLVYTIDIEGVNRDELLEVMSLLGITMQNKYW